MAFILKSPKLASIFFQTVRQTGVACRRKNLLLGTHFYRLNKVQIRTGTNLALSQNRRALADLTNKLNDREIDVNDITAILENLKDKGEISANYLMFLLKSCGSNSFMDINEKKITVIKDIWETGKSCGIKFDIKHFNTLIQTYVDNEYEFSPAEMLLEIETSGLEPDFITYKLLLKAYSQKGDIKGAGECLETMKQLKYSITSEEFSSLIYCHCLAGEIDKAEKILDIMKTRHIEPSYECYSHLACYYARQKDFLKMENILNNITNTQNKIPDGPLLNIVYELLIIAEYGRVHTLLEKYLTRDRNGMGLRVVFRLLHQKLDKDAMFLLNKLEKFNYFNNFWNYGGKLFIDYYLKYRTPEELFNMIEQLIDKEHQMFGCSYALKRAIMKMPLDFTLNLIKVAKDSGFPIRTHYFYPLIIQNSKKGNGEIIKILAAMKLLQIPPNTELVKDYVVGFYNFGKNWEDDIKELEFYGIRLSSVAPGLADLFLKTHRISDFEILVSRHPIGRPTEAHLTMLANYLIRNTHETKKIVNILYCLIHDAFIRRKEKHSSPIEVAERFYKIFLGELTKAEEHVLVQLLKKDVLQPNGSWSSIMQIQKIMKYGYTGSPELNFFVKNRRKSNLEPLYLLNKKFKDAPREKLLINPEIANFIRKRVKNPEVDNVLGEIEEKTAFQLNDELLLAKESAA